MIENKWNSTRIIENTVTEWNLMEIMKLLENEFDRMK
jgi:hypothetical protein